MGDRRSALTEAVRSSPIETMSGFFLLIAGGTLDLALSSAVPVRATGYAVSTVGTLLVSWALTRAWVARQHDDAIARSLGGIAGTLSTVTSHLNHTAQLARTNEVQVQCDVVEYSVQHLFTVLSQLQSLIGSPISVEDVVAVKERLDTLGEELAAVEPAIEDAAASDVETKARMARALEEVQNIKIQLDSVLGRDRVRKQESVVCPSCGTNTNVQLGPLPGDSAMAICPNQSCMSPRYHVHRGPDGRVTTRMMGTAGLGTTMVRVRCPNGPHDVPLNVARGDTAVKLRYCLTCFAKLQIDPATLTATVVKSAEPPLIGVFQVVVGIAHIVCPICHQARREFATRDSAHYAVCEVGDKLLRAQLQPAAVALENTMNTQAT